jgi:hypothetical protein
LTWIYTKSDNASGRGIPPCPNPFDFLMMKSIKTLIICFIACSFFLCTFSAAWSEKGNIDFKLEGHTLSANLKEIPLKFILERLEKERGIWFQGDEALFEEEVTVQFKDLTLQDGLKRILSSMNYCLLFDQDKKLNGMILIGKKKPDRAIAKGRAVRAGRSISSRTPRKHITNREVFKVARNIPPPGGPVRVTAKELKNFKVIKNCPPPGGPVKATAKELEHFKIIRNCPPPGGHVKVTTEELEEFKVIKNCPPPGS